VLSWTRSDLPAYSFSRDRAGKVPAVYVSNLRQWADVDRWYARLFAPQSASNPAIAAKARSLVEGLRDRRAKVAAIYQFVESHVDYLGIEFGIGAYQPRPAGATLSRAKGDCKDMTALMVAMLDSLGIAAYPALVRPREQGGFVPEHASPGQFSHVLLYVPDKKGDLWLDATSGLSTLTAVPTSLRGQRTLVVDGRGGQLKTIPEGRPAAHRLSQTTTYALTPTGGGTLSLDLEMTGDAAGLARRRLLAVEPERRVPLLAAPGYFLGSARVPDRVTFDGLKAPRAPLTISAAQTDPDLVAVRLDGALVLPFRLQVMPDSALVTAPPETWFETPRTFERRMVLKAPAGYRFKWKPLQYTGKAGAVHLQVRERRTGSTAEIVTRLTVKRGRLAEGERAKLLAELRRAEATLDTALEMLPGKNFDHMAFMRTVAGERPDDVRIQLHYARILLDADQLKPARAAILQANRVDPNHPAAQALLAAVSVRMGDFQAAEVPLRKLIQRNDASATVYGTLATVLMEQSRPGAAVDVLTAGVKRFPDEPELARHRIGALQQAGRQDEALTAARKMLRRSPDDPILHGLIGDIAAELGQNGEAEAAYRAGLALNPKFSRLMNNLAWLLRDDPARRAEAIGLARKAVMLRPDGSAAWDTLAELLFRSGEYEAALKAIEMAANHAESEREKALYARRRIKYRKALKSPPRN
jgi:tetratricopeptide (TPR) repeat protein